jgi:hypothetical protein
MAKGKRWTLTEETCLAKALLAATENPFRGADQTYDDFTRDLINNVKVFSPQNVEEGRFYHRTDSAIIDEHRKLKTDVQLFNKSLLIIWSSNPSGVSESEKIAMAVAIHMGATSRMDYHYKNYDVTKWKFFGAWGVLKNSPKYKLAVGAGATADPVLHADAVQQHPHTTPDADKENASQAVHDVMQLNMSVSRVPSMGKKSAEEKRSREIKEKKKEELKLERHANIMASLSDSTDAHIAHVAKAAKASELMKKRSHNVFTLGTTVLALRSSNDPQAVAVLNQDRKKDDSR